MQWDLEGPGAEELISFSYLEHDLLSSNRNAEYYRLDSIFDDMDRGDKADLSEDSAEGDSISAGSSQNVALSGGQHCSSISSYQVGTQSQGLYQGFGMLALPPLGWLGWQLAQCHFDCGPCLSFGEQIEVYLRELRERGR